MPEQRKFISASTQASYGGEDAFFISQQGSTTFGVADGVGGWANSGVNPAGTKVEPLLTVVLLSSNASQSVVHCSLLEQQQLALRRALCVAFVTVLLHKRDRSAQQRNACVTKHAFCCST